MSGFLKTVSNLEQSFFACLPAIAGREAFAVLQKPGGASVKEGTLGQKAKVPGYQLVPRERGVGVRAGFIPWWVRRITERGFLLSQSAYFLCRTALTRHAPQA